MNNFDRQFNKTKRSMGGLLIFSTLMRLTFWLGLIGGGLYLLRYFEII